MINPISIIEQAIINQLQQASSNDLLGYKIEKIASYGGEIDDDVSILIKNSSPAVWVTFVGENDPQTKLGRPDCALVFSIIVYVRNLQHEHSSRLGNKQKVGAYQIITDIKKLLIKQDFGLAIQPLDFVSTKPIYNGKLRDNYTSIFGLTFKTRYMLEAAQKPFESLDDFLRLNSIWTINTEQSEFNINLRKQQNG